MTHEHGAQLDRGGFVMVHNLVANSEIERITDLVDCEQQTRANVRNVFGGSPALRDLVLASGIVLCARQFLGKAPILTRAILFDKRAGANWAVGWHQDVTIAVARKVDVPGFSAWSVKDGVVHVQPPAEILERMLTLRLHLDDCLEDNGALQVLPGSHAHGKLTEEAVTKWSQQSAVTCSMTKGGALLMRPLLLHRSSPAKLPSHRRVLHLEFAGETLPDGLEWNIA
jgi:ectoine hydroxylase-related dioxygenase (phytanoyl-CoA dioxygenase family)